MEEQIFGGHDVQSHRILTMDSVIAEDHLLIESSRKAPELYDLFSDPANQRNLAPQFEHRGRQERLKRTLDSLRRKSEVVQGMMD